MDDYKQVTVRCECGRDVDVIGRIQRCECGRRVYASEEIRIEVEGFHDFGGGPCA